MLPSRQSRNTEVLAWEWTFDLIFLFSFTKAVIQKGTSKPWSDFRLWKVFLFGLSVSHRILVYFSQHFGFHHSVRHKPQCLPTSLISAKRKINHLFDVLGDPETYFLPSGWKLKITSWSFQVACRCGISITCSHLNRTLNADFPGP